MFQRFIPAVGLLFLLALPLIAQEQEQEKKTYTCSTSSSRRGTARVGSGAGVRSMGTIETQTQKTVRFLPCDVPDGIAMSRFEGTSREGLDAVLATINQELKKKKQLTLRVDPAVEEALAMRQAKYLPGGYRVEDLLNNLCGGGCAWQFEEEEDGRVLLISPPPAAAAP